MASVPLFAYEIRAWVYLIILVITVLVEIFAFAHCVTRRKDAFLAVGNVPKSGWVAMTGGALAVTFLLGYPTAIGGGSMIANILAMAGMVVALIYILDLRPALRDAVDGRGPW
jgi:Protein of unknown function (DUF2516)